MLHSLCRLLQKPVAAPRFRRSAFLAFVSGAAGLAAFMTPAPAAAGGWGYYGPAYYGHFYGPRFYGPRYYGRPFYGRRWRYRGHRGYYRRRRGLGGAEAAVITAGILGGVVLIDRALRENNRPARVERIYLPRDYDPEYDRRYGGLAPSYDRERQQYYLDQERDRLRDERRRLDDERRRLEDERQAFEFDRRRLDDERRRLDERRFERRRFDEERRGPRPPEGPALAPETFDFDEESIETAPARRAPPSSRPSNPRPRETPAPDLTPNPTPDSRPNYDPLEGELLGASAYLRTAFDACVAETRAAARNEGLIVALPGAPGAVERIGEPAGEPRGEQLENGAYYRMTAGFTAQDSAGESYRREMSCEADANGVRYLEIV